MIAKIKQLRLYYFTLRYLKPRQIFYQVYYRIQGLAGMNKIHILTKAPIPTLLTLKKSISAEKSYNSHVFTFLNLEKNFEGNIVWNFKDYGKLWTYNLNYFEYLNQEDIETTTALGLIDSYCENPERRKEGCEPYPISLRGINWIKFFSQRGIINATYSTQLYSHYKFLSSHLEYHLLGNHLLENGFSLLFGAYYFKDEKFYKRAEGILKNELREQILNDGAHFELSPMYHQILLFRLLDCINLLQQNDWKENSLLLFLKRTASSMLGWLKAVTFNNGEVPMVNDAAYGIAPNSISLFDYANRLGVSFEESKLSESGYRVIRSGSIEMFVDVGNIGPNYIPGHAHSDTLNFVMHAKNKPIIVDTGTSTYELNNQRIFERSTQSHNTVVVNNTNQSEVWASFRVGKRAKIIELQESYNSLSATHNGYQGYGIYHQRSWQWNENKVIITDTLKCTDLSKAKGEAFFHLHPQIHPQLEFDSILLDSVIMKTKGAIKIEIEEYNYALGFNKTITAKVLRICFVNTLQVEFVVA